MVMMRSLFDLLSPDLFYAGDSVEAHRLVEVA